MTANEPNSHAFTTSASSAGDAGHPWQRWTGEHLEVTYRSTDEAENGEPGFFVLRDLVSGSSIGLSDAAFRSLPQVAEEALRFADGRR